MDSVGRFVNSVHDESTRILRTLNASINDAIFPEIVKQCPAVRHLKLAAELQCSSKYALLTAIHRLIHESILIDARRDESDAASTCSYSMLGTESGRRTAMAVLLCVARSAPFDCDEEIIDAALSTAPFCETQQGNSLMICIHPWYMEVLPLLGRCVVDELTASSFETQRLMHRTWASWHNRLAERRKEHAECVAGSTLQAPIAEAPIDERLRVAFIGWRRLCFDLFEKEEARQKERFLRGCIDAMNCRRRKRKLLLTAGFSLWKLGVVVQRNESTATHHLSRALKETCFRSWKTRFHNVRAEVFAFVHLGTKSLLIWRLAMLRIRLRMSTMRRCFIRWMESYASQRFVRVQKLKYGFTKWRLQHGLREHYRRWGMPLSTPPDHSCTSLFVPHLQRCIKRWRGQWAMRVTVRNHLHRVFDNWLIRTHDKHKCELFIFRMRRRVALSLLLHWTSRTAVISQNRRNVRNAKIVLCLRKWRRRSVVRSRRKEMLCRAKKHYIDNLAKTSFCVWSSLLHDRLHFEAFLKKWGRRQRRRAWILWKNRCERRDQFRNGQLCLADTVHLESLKRSAVHRWMCALVEVLHQRADCFHAFFLCRYSFYKWCERRILVRASRLRCKGRMMNSSTDFDRSGWMWTQRKCLREAMLLCRAHVMTSSLLPRQTQADCETGLLASELRVDLNLSDCSSVPVMSEAEF